MLERIEATLERFRIHFDSWARQSELAAAAAGVPAAPRHLREGRRGLGALVGLRRRGRPRADPVGAGGTPTYRAADVVYLVDKLDRGFDRAIYVLGADHHGTRNWYAAVARMLGYDPDRVEVLLYQLVHLTKGGEATKMSKRRGDVVFLDELLDEVGVDAARWYLVVARPRPDDRDRRRPRGREDAQKNPVYYVQYAHARIAGILRNAGDAAIVRRAAGRARAARSAT